jgi:hypothetical protein
MVFCGWLLGVEVSSLSPLRAYGVKKYAPPRIGYSMVMDYSGRLVPQG